MLKIPPRALTLRLKRVRSGEVRVAADQRRQFVAYRVDPRLEPVVEHVRDHDRSARHPLSRTPELGMVKLRYAPRPPTIENSIEVTAS